MLLKYQWIANGYLCGIFETTELSRILFYNLSDAFGMLSKC